MHEHTIDVVSPFPPEELPRVWLWLQEAGSSLLNDQGPRTMDAFVDDWLARRSVTWGVYRDGLLGGWLAYEPLNEQHGNVHCVFRKAFWGSKTTLPAIAEAINDIFGIGVLTLGMLVPMANRAIQDVIRRLGGVKEADIARLYTRDGQTLTQNGEPMPMIQYRLYAEDWYAKQNQADAKASVADNSNGRVDHLVATQT